MSLIESVHQYAKERNEFTVGEVADGLKANPGSVKSALWRLMSQGYIDKVGKRGKRALYAEVRCQTNSPRTQSKPKRLSSLRAFMSRLRWPAPKP